jgi:PilZ domain
MSDFVLRKYRRLKRLIPLRYWHDARSSEGILTDLSMSGASISGNVPVTVGMVLALYLLVPGDMEPLVIERVLVKWVAASDFGVAFEALDPTVSARITTMITRLITTQHSATA